ncbi:MAG TPA: HAMP domain-containing sensor histidine kinase [Baekduia sp.]|nr:HAMP domain-containing sensor histidine kinase [Baekduia sp.]
MSTVQLRRPPLLGGVRPGMKPTLYRRLMLAYTGVLVLALLALLFAPIRVSVPIRVGEALVLCVGGVLMLAAFHLLLRRALDPLERLTSLMQRVDPLAPGQRIDVEVRDGEVAALTRAFNAMLDRLEGERRDSARRALAAQEGERRRIARELHDEIGQVLTGLVLRSETLSRRAPDELRGDLEELREDARRGAEDVRSIARRLRPEALDELGLQSALLALCSAVSQRAGLTFTRRLDRDLPLTAEQELVIYRVAQESITNVVRHAHATAVDLQLSVDGSGAVELVVRDDGVGLPAGVEHQSNGLRGMRERALLVGGEVHIGAAHPRGTVVTLRLPRTELP